MRKKTSFLPVSTQIKEGKEMCIHVRFKFDVWEPTLHHALDIKLSQ